MQRTDVGPDLGRAIEESYGDGPPHLRRDRPAVRGAELDAMFTEFVVARRTHLRRIAYGICGNWHQADDILQIALVKL